MYNFDDLVERRGTSSLKFDYAKKRGLPEDVQPLWVADMDFQTPDEVIEALVEKSRHGIFGYTESDETYYQVLSEWFQRRHHLQVEASWAVQTPGVVFAINVALRAYTKPGDSVLIQRPVYYPFFQSIEANGRRVVSNSLINNDGHYEIDFVDFEKKIQEEDVKLFILCSPHNPASRVWSRQELEQMGDICQKYNVLILADEIHADIVFAPHEHICFYNVKESYADNVILCTSPSKTFNLAGLQISNVIIKNKKLRYALLKEMQITGYSEAAVMGLTACQAAYTYGDSWLEEVKDYIYGNFKYAKEYLKEYLPKVKVLPLEGTYLMWLDFRELGISAEELDRIMIHEAKLWLDGGTMFGEEGAGYQRVNLATSRANIEKAMNSIKTAFCKY